MRSSIQSHALAPHIRLACPAAAIKASWHEQRCRTFERIPPATFWQGMGASTSALRSRGRPSFQKRRSYSPAPRRSAAGEIKLISDCEMQCNGSCGTKGRYPLLGTKHCLGAAHHSYMRARSPKRRRPGGSETQLSYKRQLHHPMTTMRRGKKGPIWLCCAPPHQTSPLRGWRS